MNAKRHTQHDRNRHSCKQMIKAILESIAVGDAMGMPTEFMTRESIESKFGQVNHLIDPGYSLIHSDLKYAQITDDTEQNVYLIKEYCAKGSIEVENTAVSLLNWIRETGAIEKKYIGPSSLKALKAIEAGEDPHKAGQNGTTCGGIMRTPAAVLCTREGDRQSLIRNVQNCCIPTHNTSTALEAAMAYAFAMEACLQRSSIEEVIEKAVEGAAEGIKRAPYKMCAASSGERIRYLWENRKCFDSGQKLLDFLFNVFGTGMESEDVCAAVFGIFMFAGEDVWLAIRLGASLGGDTDTVAALAAALCCAYAGRHNIPDEILETVLKENNLDFEEVSDTIVKVWRQEQ